MATTQVMISEPVVFTPAPPTQELWLPTTFPPPGNQKPPDVGSFILSESKRKDTPVPDETFLVGGGKTELAHHLSTVPHYPYTSDYGPGLPGRDWATGGRPHSPPNLRQPCLESTHRHPGSHPPNFWAFWGLFLADKGVTAGSGDKVVQVTRWSKLPPNMRPCLPRIVTHLDDLCYLYWGFCDDHLYFTIKEMQ